MFAMWVSLWLLLAGLNPQGSVVAVYTQQNSYACEISYTTVSHTLLKSKNIFDVSIKQTPFLAYQMMGHNVLNYSILSARVFRNFDVDTPWFPLVFGTGINGKAWLFNQNYVVISNPTQYSVGLSASAIMYCSDLHNSGIRILLDTDMPTSRFRTVFLQPTVSLFFRLTLFN